MDRDTFLSAIKDQQGLISAIVNLLLEASRTDQTLIPDIIDLFLGNKSIKDVLKAHPQCIFALIQRLPVLIDQNGVNKILANI